MPSVCFTMEQGINRLFCGVVDRISYRSNRNCFYEVVNGNNLCFLGGGRRPEFNINVQKEIREYRHKDMVLYTK